MKVFKPRPCDVCQIEFTPLVSGKEKRCSAKCRAEYHVTYMREWSVQKTKAANAGKTPKHYFCEICEREFKPNDRSRNQKTCGEECRKEKLRRYNAEASAMRWQRVLKNRADGVTHFTGGAVAKDPPPKPGLPCGMDPEDEEMANAELRAMADPRMKADRYIRNLIAQEMHA